jgi:hypothetical protein
MSDMPVPVDPLPAAKPQPLPTLTKYADGAFTCMAYTSVSVGCGVTCMSMADAKYETDYDETER